jgi:CheY-like chemotaxis protein
LKTKPGWKDRSNYPVLVEDDEKIVRKTAEFILRNRGYQAIVAENGQHALELFRKVGGNVAMVPLEMTMPVVSGAEAFRRLKDLLADVPAILCSGVDYRFPKRTAMAFPTAVHNPIEKESFRAKSLRW